MRHSLFLSLDAQPIPWRDKAEYLGLMLDRNLNFDTHLKTSYQKAKGLLALLYPLLNEDSALNIRNKLRIYYSIIRSQLTYAAPVRVFANAKKRFHQMQVIQKKTLRICTGAHKDLEVRLRKFVTKIAENFFEKAK